MTSLLGALARGAAAGAAGTTALNATTYVDMAVRGRGTSSAPEDVVEKTAANAGDWRRRSVSWSTVFWLTR